MQYKETGPRSPLSCPINWDSFNIINIRRLIELRLLVKLYGRMKLSEYELGEFVLTSHHKSVSVIVNSTVKNIAAISQEITPCY